MKDGTEVDLAEEDADRVTDLFVLSAACDITIFVTANNKDIDVSEEESSQRSLILGR